ncbi:MAG: hypothetical protein ABS79_00080 [Planctomycetes bacterium SCN 63-9]|nr:MAG: hypothetical protein ABS79_00080 [Planctomycetes bacterium SCN 63-9]
MDYPVYLREIPRNTWHRRLYLRYHIAAAERAGSLMIVFAVMAVLATLFLPGCSGSGASLNAPVDGSAAREALKTTLESWKRGDAPKSLQSASQPITVQDLDWTAGMTLVDYQIMGDGVASDANLSVPVKLTLSGGPSKKKSHEKKVFYLIGTSPATTVFRDMFKS